MRLDCAIFSNAACPRREDELSHIEPTPSVM
jgi:hypothetical protein